MSRMPMPAMPPASDDSPQPVRVRAQTYGEVVDTHALAWPGAPRDPMPDPAGRRRAQPADFLLPIARRWLAALPSAVRPHALAQRFPRLANRLAAAWDDEPSLALVFADLLIDQRGERRGFPPAVKADLHRLWRHWQRARAAATRAAA